MNARAYKSEGLRAPQPAARVSPSHAGRPSPPGPAKNPKITASTDFQKFEGMVLIRIFRVLSVANRRLRQVESLCGFTTLSSKRLETVHRIGQLRFLSTTNESKPRARPSDLKTCPLISKYNDLVTDQILKEDKRQLRLVHELSGLLAKLKLKAVPNGIYIHGSVGTGKSMLFDLFFEAAKHSLPERAAVRFHFHEFMISIHKHIHEYKQNSSSSQGAILTIGSQLVQKGLRLLCLDEFQVQHSPKSIRVFPRTMPFLPLRITYEQCYCR
jgi:hypothetical protein